MAKRCPPGVICIENVTIIIVFIIVASVVVFPQLEGTKHFNQSENNH